MNPVFLLLVFLGVCLLWFLCAFLYRPIGKFFSRLFIDAKEAMFEENKEKEQ